MSRRARRGRHRNRRSPVATAPACTAFDKSDGRRRLGMFKSTVITVMFLWAMTTAVVVSIAVEHAANLPYKAWGDDYGPIGTPRHNLSERARVQLVFAEDNTQAHPLPDSMTPTDLFKDVLRACHRVAILDGEMEMSLFKWLERHLLDEVPENVDRPHTQIYTVQENGFEAWDFIPSGENHANNARVRTRRRVGVYTDVPHRENELKSLETKVGLKDDERDGAMDSVLTTDDNVNHWNNTRVPYKVISDMEATNIDEGRHHHIKVPTAPTEDGKLDRPGDTVPPDEISASNATRAETTELTPETDFSKNITRAENNDVKNADVGVEMDLLPPDETSVSNATHAAKMTELTPEIDASINIERKENSDVKTMDAAAEMDTVPPDETSASNAPPAEMAELTPETDCSINVNIAHSTNSDIKNPDAVAKNASVLLENDTDPSLHPSPEVAIVVVGALVVGSVAYSCMMQIA
ncbi:Hypp3139 [Branchiostoma lanceolatum]|uniref:Hypp3139 protein n=1 Tax=Branchiostoma lanceolatum TaxID=7740 RepID=A0A8K0ET95_BRALA|nr:Hypp3139 [Branchiostoma lanceolatum]